MEEAISDARSQQPGFDQLFNEGAAAHTGNRLHLVKEWAFCECLRRDSASERHIFVINWCSAKHTSAKPTRRYNHHNQFFVEEGMKKKRQKECLPTKTGRSSGHGSTGSGTMPPWVVIFPFIMGSSTLEHPVWYDESYARTIV